ncbi:hypothetical protein ACTJKC_08730 [Pedobacter sp. 22226]|uniref:hypothetical protein n=1 Tax=Pedobacter sp. 22226 TaxID=3453894 RepID=UPI003F84E8EA
MKNLFQKTIVLSSVFVLPYLAGHAQLGVNLQLANNDVNYSGNTTKGNNDVSYLYETWNKGSVKLSNDSLYKGMNLMYDLSNDRLIFKADNDLPQLFKLAVKEFTITSSENGGASKKFKSGYPSIDGGNEKTFYEILSEGKITLLKRVQMKRVDEREAGMLYSVKKMKPVDTYFIEKAGKLEKIKRERSAIYPLLSQNKAEVDSYISSNKLNIKKDSDLSVLFDHFNTL